MHTITAAAPVGIVGRTSQVQPDRMADASAEARPQAGRCALGPGDRRPEIPCARDSRMGAVSNLEQGKIFQQIKIFGVPILANLPILIYPFCLDSRVVRATQWQTRIFIGPSRDD
ncbi:hypothetical protein ACRBEV_18720 [Methylobacterium phyllosphaerae]